MTDAAIFTISLGWKKPDPFAAFVPGWWAAIAAMHPRPAEVCIAVAEGDASTVTDVPIGFPVPVRFVTLAGRSVTQFLTAAVLASTARWLVWCGLDDRMKPDALRDIADADAAVAELVAARYEAGAGGPIRGGWNVAEMAFGGVNNTSAASPFRRDLFNRVGGWPDIHFHDWGLWLRMARAGAVVFDSPRVGMVQDLGYKHATRSGVQMPDSQRHLAMAEICKLVEENGFQCRRA
jgi:hypothetical protein